MNDVERKSMKKIGIITYYYKSINYGGNLQAYALVELLRELGYEAEQVCFDASLGVAPIEKKDSIVELLNKGTIITRKVIGRVKALFLKKRIKEKDEIIRKKKSAFENFNSNMIAHSEKVYNRNNIKDANAVFDFFITGSDQVFNGFNGTYYLDFTEKKKISYAASMALDEIPEDKKQFVYEALKSFSSISVREEKTKELLEELGLQNIQVSLDPTLLISTDKWDTVASQRVIGEKYVFCYFLGSNPKSRNLAVTFSERRNLKIVCIPMRYDRFQYYDLNYGDFSFPYASPEDFISLIKHAEYVITDSFHACAFSLIYKKQFIVFNRDEIGSMNTRIKSLLELFNCEERLVTEERIDIVEEVLQNNFFDFSTYENKKIQSLEYLKKSLER